MDKRVLVSAAGGDIGQAVLMSLEDAGMTVFGCDMRECAFLRDRAFTVPSAASGDEYIASILNIIERHDIGFFIPISEPEISLVDRKRQAFGSTGVAINNSRVVELFSDKYRTVSFLSSLGFKVPLTTPLDALEEGAPLSFPCVIKSRTGCGSKKLWIADEELDLDYFRRKNAGNLIAQELVGKAEDEYTTGIFSNGERVDSITFRRRLGLGGLTIEAELVHSSELNTMAQEIALAVRLRGSINLQTRKVGKDFLPFEINPRLSSTVPIRRKFGFDDAVWWIDMLGNETYSFTLRYSRGRAFRCLSEVYVDLESAEPQQGASDA